VPHDVFISYSSIDKAAALAACATFEAARIRCWIAPRDVAAGAEWAEEIINAIEAARIMVLIFSANSNESRQVKREIELAVSRGLTIMPLRLEKIEPTKSMAYYMAGVHWIDAISPPLETHLKKMVEWIRPHLAGEASAGEPTPPPRAKVEARPPPKAEPSRPAVKQPVAQKPQRKSSIFGDFLYEFFGVGSVEGGLKIGEAAKAIDAAVKLGKAGRTEDAIAAYLALIERIEAAPAAPLDLNLAIATFNLGVMYRAAGRPEDAVNAYRDVVRRCGDIDDSLIKDQVAMALNNQASLLLELGRPRDALGIYDDLLQRYGESLDTQLATQSAMARLNRGVALGALGRHEDAISAYDEAIARTDTRVFPKLASYAAMALVNKGIRQVALGRRDAALLTYDDVVSRFGQSRDAALREQVAKALANGASQLIDLKRYDEALAKCQRVIDGSRDTPVLVEMAALTMRNKVVALRGAGRTAEAIAAADAMLSDFGKSDDKAIAVHAAAVRQIRSAL
jgi:tetratricopeptide (TPR) repeat protein